MSKKTFKNKKNDQWEYDDTPEVRAAIAKLHQDISKLEETAPDYGIGK
jgi:hypothetical protein